MPNYLTPGVHFETLDATRRGVTAIRTDIAAFIGLAERGALHQPAPIESWRQFQTAFGDFVPYGYLAYCVKAFFENGGERCYVVRVAAPDATTASGDLIGLDGNPTLAIRASSPGRWGNQVQVRLGKGLAAATQTTVVPTDNGSASSVGSTLEFPPGTLVRLFQQNGSGTMDVYNVVAKADPIFRRLTWVDALHVTPAFPGDLVFDLTQPIDLETVTFTLSVYEKRRLMKIYANLSLVPDNARYVVDVIADDPTALIAVEDLHQGLTPQWADWQPDLLAETVQLKQGVLSLQCGTDGLTNLGVIDFTGDVGSSIRTGLRTLEIEPEVSLVAIPDIMVRPTPSVQSAPPPPAEIDPCCPPPPPSPLPLPPGTCPDVAEQPPAFGEGDILYVQQALVRHCETLADRFVLLDPLPPEARAAFDPSRVLQWRQNFDSSYAALYYPWTMVVDPLRIGGQLLRAIPPSGHVAGVIAWTDLNRGVHIAPANRVLYWMQAFSEEINETWQGVLNPVGINVLRTLPGRGLRVYGARTVSSDTQVRFVNVRRTLLMIEKALDLSLQWTVFEPNDDTLRQLIALAVSGFLTALWQRGALVGNSPEEAFFVRCDADNNPPDSLALGRLNVEIGVAIVQPAEFIIIRVGRTEDELTLVEVDGGMA
jgi:phage tail sheath protein FI